MELGLSMVRCQFEQDSADGMSTSGLLFDGDVLVLNRESRRPNTNLTRLGPKVRPPAKSHLTELPLESSISTMYWTLYSRDFGALGLNISPALVDLQCTKAAGTTTYPDLIQCDGKVCALETVRISLASWAISVCEVADNTIK